MSRLSLVCLLLLVCQGFCLDRPWMNKSLTPEDRALKLVGEMTLDEKIDMVHGHSGIYTGNTPVNQRLGIPALTMNDGPQGFRGDSCHGTTTQFPSLMTVAATFDRELVKQYSGAIAQEFLDKGSNVLLGPGMNLARVPVNGRNFEYGTGEDPYLGSEVVKNYIQTVQGMGVIATAKHYVNNEQENDRTTISANLDERTAWELYYRPFMAAVEAGVTSMMCSYNKIGDVWACENNSTLNTALKERMGFKGWVMSDWGATHSTLDSANHGLDQEMPDDQFFGSALKTAVQNGTVPESRVTDMVYRILYGMFAVGIFDKNQTGDFNANVTRPEHYDLSRKLISNSTVLLKNDRQILPINAANVTTIAVLGDAGDLKPVVSGYGSGQVYPAHIVSALEGIKARLGNNTNINVVYAPTQPIDQAINAAKSADYALVFTGTSSSEGGDRANLSLPDADNSLIKGVAAVNPRTVVVVTSPGHILLPWSDSVPAILASLLPGEQFGHAIADLLFGAVNPCARLPITLPNIENEVGFTPLQYPGVNLESNYSEGLQIGYRWYDAHQVTPRFPFGHGLSYTTFKYGNVVAFPHKHAKNGLTGVTVVVNVKNAGPVAGAEVVQLYLGYPPAANEPPKQLRGFEKVYLEAGQVAQVKFDLSNQDISIWDVKTHDWTVVPGAYQIMVGASSRDIRLTGSFQVSGQKHIHTMIF